MYTTKLHLVKAMVFPVVMYGCESWTIKKAECRIDAFELWCWRRLLRVPWAARRSNQSILKEISPEYSLEGLMLMLKFSLVQSLSHVQLFATPWTAAHQASLSITNSWSLLKLNVHQVSDAEDWYTILWPPDAKNWLIGKDPDAGEDWRWEEKEMTEDEMIGWHHQLDGCWVWVNSYKNVHIWYTLSPGKIHMAMIYRLMQREIKAGVTGSG